MNTIICSGAPVGLVVLVFMLIPLVITSCALLKAVGDSAPPAAVPLITDKDVLFKWPNDNNYYSKRTALRMLVQFHVANELFVRIGGTDLMKIDYKDYNKQKDAAAQGKPFWTREDKIFDGANKTTAIIYIRQPNNFSMNDHSIDYSIVEHSINPNYKGKPEEFASLDFPVVYLDSKPIISSFNSPATVTSGGTANVDWIVDYAKKVELFREGNRISEQFNPGSGPFSGSASITISADTKLKLRATNAVSDVVEQERTIFLQPNCICPGETYPNCQGPYQFTFCATCPSNDPAWPYYYTFTVWSCSESLARQYAQSQYANCQLSAGACPSSP